MSEFLDRSIEAAIEKEGEIITSSAGISMYPMLRNKRDMIVVEKVTRKLKKHDVPVYRLASGKLVMHRILKVTDNGYIIRGDNLFKKELNVTDDMIIGVLKSFYRNEKHYVCAESKVYKFYVLWIRASYPLRWFYEKLIRPILRKIKHLLLGKPKNT